MRPNASRAPKARPSLHSHAPANGRRRPELLAFRSDVQLFEAPTKPIVPATLRTGGSRRLVQFPDLSAVQPAEVRRVRCQRANPKSRFSPEVNGTRLPSRKGWSSRIPSWQGCSGRRRAARQYSRTVVRRILGAAHLRHAHPAAQATADLGHPDDGAASGDLAPRLASGDRLLVEHPRPLRPAGAARPLVLEIIICCASPC
jgi:hypothetical protein